jgi:hypothetical protein
VLPLLPAAAILVAGAWTTWLVDRGDATARRVLRASSVALAALAFAAGLALAAVLVLPDESLRAWAHRSNDVENGIAVGREIGREPMALVALVAGVAALGVFTLAFVWRGRPGVALGAAAAGVIALTWLAVLGAMPASTRRVTLRPLVEAIDSKVPRDATIFNRNAFEWQVMYYGRRRLPSLDDAGFARFVDDPRGAYCLLSQATLDALPADARRRLAIAASTSDRDDAPSEKLLVVGGAGAR